MQGLKSLLVSRKFWITVLGLVGPIYMYATHAPGMTGPILAGLLAGAAGVLSTGIAIEDHGTNSAPVMTAAGGDVVTNVVAPQPPITAPETPSAKAK